MTEVAPAAGQPLPLCVDLDGTLLRTDSLDECLWAALGREPAILWRLPLWLSRGRARLKEKLAPYGIAGVANWPMRASVLELVRRERAAGAPVLLVTAADRSVAEAVAARVGLFDGVVASDGALNLRGAAKAAELCRRFGEKGFRYVGDSGVDRAVWAVAAGGYRVITGSRSLTQEERDLSLAAIREPLPRLSDWVRQLRLHQWSKNALLLVPMLAAHRFTDAALWLQVLIGMLCLGLVASGTYVLNDCLDLDGDRRVPSKRDRPIARGDLPLRAVVLAGLACFAAGLAGAAALDTRFGLLVLLYAAATICYSAFLKRQLLVDVLLLGGFYVLRLVMGAALASVPLSPWFLGFALFFFISIALAKRYAELLAEHRAGVVAHLRRPYREADLPVILASGMGSSLVTVLVLALYVNSDQSQQLYASPALLWLMCPVLLYWMLRVWFKAQRGELSVDPVLFALRDRVSYIVLGLLVGIPLLACLPF